MDSLHPTVSCPLLSLRNVVIDELSTSFAVEMK